MTSKTWREKVESAVRGLRLLKRDFNMRGANATTVERVIQTLQGTDGSKVEVLANSHLVNAARNLTANDRATAVRTTFDVDAPVWHGMDAVTVVYYGPWIRKADHLLALERLQMQMQHLQSLLGEARETNQRLNRRAQVSEGMFVSFRMSFTEWKNVMFKSQFPDPLPTDSHANFIAWCSEIDKTFAQSRAAAAEAKLAEVTAELDELKQRLLAAEFRA